MHKYNPRKKDYQQLDSSLVGAARRDFLNTIIKELSLKSDESPKQHWLVVGPRGIGKSHLLTLLYHKVKLSPELSRLWIPVLFPEETRMESNLAKFLERAVNEIIHELHENDLNTAEAIRDKIARTKTLPAQERDEYLFSVLAWITEATGKYILFITENLQHLLGKKLSLLEQKKLRAFLQTSDTVTVFNALHDHSNPFYNFFHIHRLTDLTFDEMKVMIGAILTATGRTDLAERVNLNEARIKAFSVFTGGNPRMAVFLADILKTDVPEETLDLMDGILDELTPYFETIFKDIPDCLEAVINTLAAFEPAQSPTEITAHLEGQSTTIRNYLKQLKDNGYVRVAFSRGRSNYYCLNEYLYRIWFQMRDSGHREETRWLLELLLMLYSPATLLEEFLPYGRALAVASDQEGALDAYLKYIKFNLGNYFTDLDFQKLYQEDIQPVLAKMTPGSYIEKLYTPAEAKNLSRIRNCMILVLFGKHEIVHEHIPAILAATNGQNKAERDALELLFFSIKLMLWINLCLSKTHEALSLTELYGEYIKSLPAMNKKEMEVRSLALGLLKLQIAKNIEPESTRKIFLQLAADPDIPFAEVLLKVLTCISEPDSLQSQQFLSDKIIAEVVKGLAPPKNKKETPCDSCGISC